ncbi:MAG: DUF255 domain-containing protein [Planctomycetes bacterium]|nr:DUF255 domain-containing protein [Planctomycetota bacterium]
MLEWLEWSDEAFERARAEQRPVLLFVKASWCRFSRELEQAVLADERVERVLAERFVCIRVDKDRRPDIDARYSKGGWPTLAWLDDAGEALASDTYLDAGPLLARAELVADFYTRHRDTIRARASPRSRPSRRPRRPRPRRARRDSRWRSSSTSRTRSSRRPTRPTAAGAASTSSRRPRRSTSR